MFYMYNKSLKVNSENMREAQIFNVYIEEEGIFSVNIIKKCDI